MATEVTKKEMDGLIGQNKTLVNGWTRRLAELERENAILKKIARKMAEDIFRIVLMVDIGGSDKFVNVESVEKHYREKIGE